jgi:hypothetical protein
MELKMNAKHIEEQIAVIREATSRAASSPEAASAFLRDAGIINGHGGTHTQPKKASSNKSVITHATTKRG